MINKLLEIISTHRVATVLVILGVLILPLLFFVATTYGKTRVEVVAAPSDAEVSLNEKSGRNGLNRLKPGDYTLTVSREGFESHTETITVTDEPLQLLVMLTPLTEEAWEIVRGDASRFFEVEALIGEEAQAEGERFREINPIIEHLPYRSLIFNIDYKTPENGELILIITASNEREREYARAQIRNWGFDPTDFSIEYKNR